MSLQYLQSKSFLNQLRLSENEKYLFIQFLLLNFLVLSNGKKMRDQDETFEVRRLKILCHKHKSTLFLGD